MNAANPVPVVAVLIALFATACEYEGPPDPEPVDTAEVGDVSGPSVTITDDVLAVATGDITFTFTFSEDVGTSFDASDVQVSGGTPGAFEADVLSATLVVSVPDRSAGAVEIRVDPAVFQDLAGNPNPVGAAATRAFDTGGGSAGGTVLVDFESTDEPEIFGFGGIFGEIVEDPEDPGNRVGRVVKPTGSDASAGATLAYCPEFGMAELPVDDRYSTISVRLWAEDAGVPIRLKIEDRLTGRSSVETEVATTVAGGWQTLVFDLSEPFGSTPTIDPDATYDRLSIFPNMGVTGSAAGEKVFYIDDVTFDDLTFNASCPLRAEAGNLLADPGGELWNEDSRPERWLVFPKENGNIGYLNAFETFSPYQGEFSPGMRGQGTGADNVTAIYQEFETAPGERFTLGGYGQVYGGEPIGAPDTTAYLALKFFTDDFTYLGQSNSGLLTSRTGAGTWIELSVTASAPSRATIVQAAMEMRQCEGAKEACATSGVVAFDALRLVRAN